MNPTEAFDIDEVFRRLRLLPANMPKAAMFDLRDRGYTTPFEQLVGSLISARTRDESTMAVSLRLFATARTAKAMAALDDSTIAHLLAGASFPDAKARDIRELSRRIVEDHGGTVPDSLAGLTAFHGVGPKIAALTLAVGFGQAAIPVDIHVHRIANRWGYVTTKTPEQTMKALEAKLLRQYWIEINERCVPFGKFVCVGVSPKCSDCPLRSMCPRIGVTTSR